VQVRTLKAEKMEVEAGRKMGRVKKKKEKNKEEEIGWEEKVRKDRGRTGGGKEVGKGMKVEGEEMGRTKMSKR
jgi:hypothetical protein